MSVLKIKDANGNWIPIPTIKGDQGPKGDKGDKGDTVIGLQIKGTYATLSALQAAVASPTQGDMYNVGEAAPYHVYMWDTTEPPGAWEDQGILQGQDGAPGPNEITTATATPLSGVLVGKDGYVKEGVAGVDFAAAAHAAQHSANGADPIIPADIGAAAADDLTSHVSTLVTGAAGVHGLKQYSGTWTPELRGRTTAGTPTYLEQIGKFEVIGNQCNLYARIVLNNAGGMGGILEIGGLPFVPKPTTYYGGVCNLINISASPPYGYSPYISGAGTITFMRHSTSGDDLLTADKVNNNFGMGFLTLTFFF